MNLPERESLGGEPHGMDTNPYAPPQHLSRTDEVPPDISVDRDCLVVRDDVTLPPRCLFTNEPVDSTANRQRCFEYAPSFRLVIDKHRCRVTYGVNRKRRLALYRMRLLVFILIMFIGWLLLGYRLFWFIPVALYVVSTMPPDSLRVQRSENGRFWIAGCGDAFLQSCREEFGEYR